MENQPLSPTPHSAEDSPYQPGRGFAALGFLTILPIPGGSRPDNLNWGQTTGWYPAVGVVLGAILAGLDWGLGQFLPGGVTAALLLVSWVALTGALHLDGFIDCCDGLLAAVPPQRRLEILHDVHAGAFGISGAVLLLLTKYAALVALPTPSRLPALLLIPTLARWGMTAAIRLYPSARSGSGLGSKVRTDSGWRELILATIITLLVTALAAWLGLSWIAAVLFSAVAVAVLAAARWMQTRIGGLTGDTYGALCELGETFALLALVAIAYRGMGS